MIRKIYPWIRSQVTGLARLQDRPHAVAAGIASGIFFGFIPLLGLKTLLAMGTAKILRGNVIAAAVAVTLHDVILPIAPVLLRWEYKLGYWLLSHPHHLPPDLHAAHQGPGIWFHWSTLSGIGLPLLLGSSLVAIPAGAAAYLIALPLLRKAARNEQRAEP